MFFERFARGDLEDRARCAAGEHLAFEPLDISNLLGGEKTEPIIKVHRLYHRNDPIMTASPEYRPTARAEHCYELLRAAYIRDQVEKAGVPDVKGGASYFPRFLTVISIKQRYPGHARQAALVASQCPGRRLSRPLRRRCGRRHRCP